MVLSPFHFVSPLPPCPPRPGGPRPGLSPRPCPPPRPPPLRRVTSCKPSLDRFTVFGSLIL
eukprot:scaffold286487_cov47-Attheya_sp.AAC.1